jgi:hypothetical protein
MLEERGTFPGMILRSSNAAHFILDQQFLHKSVLLVLDDSPIATVAVVLNRRTCNAVLFKRAVEKDGEGRRRAILFGGEYQSNQGRLFWLHRSALLKGRGVGTAVGAEGEIWLCDGEEAVQAMQAGHATDADFLLVRGFCLWLKVPPCPKQPETRQSAEKCHRDVPTKRAGDSEALGRLSTIIINMFCIVDLVVSFLLRCCSRCRRGMSARTPRLIARSPLCTMLSTLVPSCLPGLRICKGNR